MSAVVVLILRILISVALYAFAAYAFYLLWVTIRKPADARSGSGIPILTLHPGKKSGMEIQRFESEEVMVGREKGCRLCLADDTVSARPARVSYRPRQWWVEALGATF